MTKGSIPPTSEDIRGRTDADIEMIEADDAEENLAADLHFDDAYYGIDERENRKEG